MGNSLAGFRMKPTAEDTWPGRACGRSDFAPGRRLGRASAPWPEGAGLRGRRVPLRFALARPPASKLIPFPPIPPRLEVGLIAPLAGVACAGTRPLRRFQPKTDQVALYGQDSQGDG